MGNIQDSINAGSAGRALWLTEDRQLCVKGGESAIANDSKRGTSLSVSIKRSGICRTDRKAAHSGQRDLRLPVILGHEGAGVIRFSSVEERKPGDRVAIYPGISCGQCAYCLSGNENLCDEIGILGFTKNGLLQNEFALSRDGVHRTVLIPDNMSFAMAALAEPASCARRQGKSLEIADGMHVLIVGGGALGVLSAYIFSHIFGASVSIIEENESKAARLREAGFTVVDSNETISSSFDAAIACAPGSRALEMAIASAKKGGRIGFFSGLTSMPDMKVLNEVHYKELTMKGSYGCSFSDFAAAVGILARPDALFLETFITAVTLGEAIAIVENEETENFFTQVDFEHPIQSKGRITVRRQER